MHGVVAPVGQSDFLETGQKSLASWISTEEAGGHREVLQRGERLVEVRAMPEEREASAGPLSLTPHVDAEDSYRSAVGANGRGQDAQQSGLARPVAARDHHELALRHLEAHVDQCPATPITPVEAGRTDGDHRRMLDAPDLAAPSPVQQPARRQVSWRRTKCTCLPSGNMSGVQARDRRSSGAGLRCSARQAAAGIGRRDRRRR